MKFLSDKVIVIFVFLATMSVYSYTLCPTVSMVDGGELIVACTSLGVAHPPGFPLYVLLGHLFSKLPFENPAVALNCMSAFFGAMTCSATFIAARLILSGRDWFSILACLISALSFGFSPTLWGWSTVAKYYTLSIFLIVLLFIFLWKWKLTDKSYWLYLAAIMYGLGLANHTATIFFSTTLFILFIGIRTKGWSFLLHPLLFKSIGIVTLTVCVFYTFTLVRSNEEPYMNWGAPKDLETLYLHVTAKQFQAYLKESEQDIKESQKQKGMFISDALELYVTQFTFVGFLIAIFGYCVLWKREVTLAIGTLILVICMFLYRINYSYDKSEGTDWRAYYLSAFFVFSLWIGLGVYTILQAVKKDRVLLYPTFALLALCPFALIAVSYNVSNKSKSYIARDFAMNALSEVEKDAIIITDRWLLYSPMMYLQHQEGIRKDVSMIDYSPFTNYPFFIYHLKKYDKNFYSTIEKEADEFVKLLDKWWRGKMRNSVAELGEPYIRLFKALINRNIKTRPIYVSVSVLERFSKNELGSLAVAVPSGLLYRLYPENPSPQISIRWNLRGLVDNSTYLDEPEKNVKRIYLQMALLVAEYQTKSGAVFEAKKTLVDIALKLDPKNEIAINMLNSLPLR